MVIFQVQQQETSSPHDKELKAAVTHRHTIPLKLDPHPIKVGTCPLPPLPQFAAPLPDCESTTLPDRLASDLLQVWHILLLPWHYHGDPSVCVMTAVATHHTHHLSLTV